MELFGEAFVSLTRWTAAEPRGGPLDSLMLAEPRYRERAGRGQGAERDNEEAGAGPGYLGDVADHQTVWPVVAAAEFLADP